MTPTPSGNHQASQRCCALSLSKGTRFDELSAHDKSYLLR
jgi:hypothetical protein